MRKPSPIVDFDDSCNVDHLDDKIRPSPNIIEESEVNQQPSSTSTDILSNNENDQQDIGEQSMLQDGYIFNAEVENSFVQDPVIINDNHYSKGLSKWEMRFAILFICLISIGVIAGITFLITNNIGDNNDGVNEVSSNSGSDNKIPNNLSTPSPTINPPTTPSPTFNPLLLQQCFNSTSHKSNFYTRIRESIIALTNVSNNTLTMDKPQTPQHKSLCWMSLVDESALVGNPLIERFSLVTLYYEWLREDKKNVLLTNWLSGEDHCDWKGVRCEQSDSKTGTVSRLEFMNMYLEGSIPPEIGNFRGLESLRLESNSINGPIPSEIRNLQDLRTLVIVKSNLMGSFESQIPDSIFDLPLVHLELQSNGLGGYIPNEFDRLSKLEVLKLQGNDFIGPIPSSIGNLTDLESLNLSYNRLRRGPIPSTFRQLTKLEYLNLYFNHMNGTLPTFLGSLTNLGFLIIGINDFKSTIPTEVGSLTNMAHMDLSFNDLFGTIPSSLGYLTNADVIDLIGNHLTGRMPQEICDLRQGQLRLLNSDCITEVSCPRTCCTSCCQ